MSVTVTAKVVCHIYDIFNMYLYEQTENHKVFLFSNYSNCNLALVHDSTISNPNLTFDNPYVTSFSLVL